MSKHTPGPWAAVINEADEHNGRPLTSWSIYTVATYPEGSVNNLTIASGYGGLSDGFAKKDEGGANAHLMAAAPEMLAMLERCAEALATLGHPQEEIDRLIAKAKGES